MGNWVTVCQESDLTPGTGVCALLEGDQVAIFQLSKNKSLYAISNYDPIAKANVLSRGLTGSINDELVVASPIYKQHFSLQTGRCIENDDQTIKIYKVRIDSGNVQLLKD